MLHGHICSTIAVLATSVLGCAPALAQPIDITAPGSFYTTPAASAELANLCPTGSGYPTPWVWGKAGQPSPVSATGGQPRIEQYRAGTLIATYSSFSDQPGCTQAGDGTDYTNPGPPAASGCGPFTRTHSFRMWAPGDTFLVYPAIYSGPYNQPWIGPMYDDPADFAAGISHAPDTITVQGVVQNNTRPVILLVGGASSNTLGQAPVYFDQSNGFTMDSINVVAGAHAGVGKAGVYELAGSNLTLSNMLIGGFARAGANGLFGAGSYSGTLTLSHLELAHNGGPNGPSHNAYIGASITDPNFTVLMHDSWSHNAVYGHLFKSRAQVNVFTANYFEGGVPTGRNTQAEAYLLDVPNGGLLTIRNNIFVKNQSGPLSNGMSVTFAMEGVSDARPQGIDIENNTFLAFSKTFDGSNLNYPLSFYYPNIRPDNAAWPVNVPVRIIKNAFVGYCILGNGTAPDYHGDLSLTESFDETSRSFAFSVQVISDDATLATLYANYQPELGTPAYTQYPAGPLVRQQMTIGAED